MDKTFAFSCPICNKILRAKTNLCGVSVTCPKCKNKIFIPVNSAVQNIEQSPPKPSIIFPSRIQEPPPLPNNLIRSNFPKKHNDLVLGGTVSEIQSYKSRHSGNWWPSFLFVFFGLAQLPLLDFLKPTLGWPGLVWWALICWSLLGFAELFRFLKDLSPETLIVGRYFRVASNYWKLTSSKVFFCSILTVFIIVEFFSPIHGIQASFFEKVANWQEIFMEQIPLEATGYGDSKEVAENDALRAAVRQRFGVSINMATHQDKGVLQKDSIDIYSVGNVTSYTIISIRMNGKMYEVTIRARVQLKKAPLWKG